MYIITSLHSTLEGIYGGFYKFGNKGSAKPEALDAPVYSPSLVLALFLCNSDDCSYGNVHMGMSSKISPKNVSVY